MHLGQPANDKTKLWIRGIAAFLVLMFLISFWHEVTGVFKLMWGLVVAMIGYKLDLGDSDALPSFNIISFNCLFGFGFVFSVWLLLISGQAILPVKGVQDIYRTAWHMILYVTGRHGPAVFVKDGKLIATEEEKKRSGHGVVSIDFNSAIVLEERDLPPGFSRLFYKIEIGFLHLFGLSDHIETVRVCGPGIVFTRPGECIRGEVDLRKHFRLQPKVTSYTREGIELVANVLSIFTIGQDPDVLQVTYVGGRRPENLRVLTLKSVQGGQGYMRLTDITDELDEQDREEIHHFARVIEHTGAMVPHKGLPAPASMPVFNRDRVFSAVFAQARNGSQTVLPWADLPIQVAADFYREIMLTINYDDLYDIKNNGRFPLPGFKGKLRLQMRNNGILAYRLVFLKSGAAFVNSRVYNETDLIVSEVQSLTNSKVLRDRGIKIIFSGFGDPSPVSQAIYKQRLDAWRATWDCDLNVTLASRELEALRVSSRARVEAQQDLWYSLSQLFEKNAYTDEALAIRVLQALEQAATDSKTRQLLPANTVDIINQVHSLLIPTDIVQLGPTLPPPPAESPRSD